MKKLVIISLAVFGLGIVSCQKQDITPNSGEGMELPVWEESARHGDSDASSGTEGGDIGAITDPNDENDNPITDPNDDNNKTKNDKGTNGSLSSVEGGN